MRVDCDAIALPNPDPKGRSSKHDDFTCNNEACATKCTWYERERDGPGFERCSADRATRNGNRGLFCADTWCTTLYKRNGGGGVRAFRKIKKEREEEGEEFA